MRIFVDFNDLVVGWNILAFDVSIRNADFR